MYVSHGSLDPDYSTYSLKDNSIDYSVLLMVGTCVHTAASTLTQDLVTRSYVYVDNIEFDNQTQISLGAVWLIILLVFICSKCFSRCMCVYMRGYLIYIKLY